MSKGVYVALSGAVAQETALDTTAVNVANASSVGFQRLRPVFRAALATAQGADPNLRFVAVARTSVDTTQGALRNTGRPLDVAMPSGAYLAVSTPAGERYTRVGALSLDADGGLRAGGAPVLGADDSPIRVAKDGAEVRVDPDGTVRQGTSSVGKLKVVRFEKPEEMKLEGAGLLDASAAGAAVPEKEPVVVGSLEESTAQPVTSMTELMSASRSFEAFQKVLDSFGEADRKLLGSVPGAFE